MTSIPIPATDTGARDTGARDSGALDTGATDTGATEIGATEIDTEPFAAVPLPLRGAMQRRGFTSLTAVQTAVLAQDSQGRDLRISSQTGSGKTVALGFVLAPELMALAKANPRPDGPLAMVIAPTRELAQQVKSELEWLLADIPRISVVCVTGGTSIPRERQQLRQGPAIVVGTPGRLLDHLQHGGVSGACVKQLVLDEADQMLDLGFRDELEAILQTMPKQRRTHLVSATFPTAVVELATRYQHQPMHVQGTALGKAHQDIAHIAHVLGPKERYGALVNLLLLAGGERTLVFVRTRQDTQTLADKLMADGFLAQPLSGDLAQAQRNRTVEAFRNGTCTTLVATDVAARGLDIPDVQSVVHADPPIDAEVYVHRSGRTGRAGQKGRSVVLTPRAAERRIKRLLQDAKVSVQWLPAPGAGEVRSALQQRAEQRLQELLQTTLPGPAQRERAARLLQEHDPVTLVGSLLAALQRDHTARGPFDLAPQAPASFAAAPHSFPREVREPSKPEPRGFTRFRINWGSRDGAEPRRILAHICRRGDIDSRMVGAIDVGHSETMFEVQSAAANDFAHRAKDRDARDPHLVIAFCGTTPAAPASARNGHGSGYGNAHGSGHGSGHGGGSGNGHSSSRSGGYDQDRSERKQRSFSRPPDLRPWAFGPRGKKPRPQR